MVVANARGMITLKVSHGDNVARFFHRKNAPKPRKSKAPALPSASEQVEPPLHITYEKAHTLDCTPIVRSMTACPAVRNLLTHNGSCTRPTPKSRIPPR